MRVYTHDIEPSASAEGFFMDAIHGQLLKREQNKMSNDQDSREKQLEVIVRSRNYLSRLVAYVNPHVLCESLCYPLRQECEPELKGELTKILTLLDMSSSCIVHITEQFFLRLPVVRKELLKDAAFIAENDPAATSADEVAMIYPGFFAIATYRLSHMLRVAGVPTIPRLFSELAHSKTGIDINPGAHIGHEFFIDHGTGIVIGETSIIGNRVKIYQGVTLGALSVHKVDAESKRHPTIEDEVTVYAGATILGGQTVVGRGSIIGGNVWLTESVPPYSKVFNNLQSKVIVP